MRIECAVADYVTFFRIEDYTLVLHYSRHSFPTRRSSDLKYGLKAHLYPFSALKENNSVAFVDDKEITITEPIAFNMEQEKLALTGQHNLYNSLAAGISANVAGITKDNIRKALSDFKGVEHRLEKVARVRGVDFINDSKATNVNSCWYALQSMTTKTVLIIGGKDKGNDYTRSEARRVGNECRL